MPPESKEDRKSQRDGFLKTAIAHLSNLTRLEVNTLVGNYKFKEENGIKTTIDQESTSEKMSSQINLISGDITVAMTEKFVSEYEELREYHIAREKQGHEIINANIETLKKIVSAIDQFRNDVDQDE